MKLHLAVCASALALSSYAMGVSISGVGTFTLNDSVNSDAGGLSGITYDPSADLFYAVNDSNSKVYPIDFNINLTSGAITSGTVLAPIQLNNAGGVAFAAGTRDQEGIAFDAATNSVWVSNEGNQSDPQTSYTPTLTRHSLSTGNQTASAVLPNNFNPAVNGPRINRSLEALSRQSNGQSMWTSNEAALELDPPTTIGNGVGTKVRLTKFDASTNLVGQWVYQIDSGLGLTSSNISTLSDLLVLPDGTLIAMERATELNYRIRLYQVNFGSAANVSGVDVLTGSETAVTKSLLWSGNFGGLSDLSQNFEGIALGPQLSNGDYSLIMTADNDNGTAHQLPFYALRISGIPEPTVLGVLGIVFPLVLRSGRRR